MNEGWVKLHRKMINWEWYLDPNVFRVFLHLLLKVNHEENKWQGINIQAGQRITSRGHLATELKMGEQSVRTALNKLKSTNEITIKTTTKYSLITILNWKSYQQLTNKSTNEQPTTNQQLTTNKNDKNDNKKKNKEAEASSAVFVWEEYLKKMDDSPKENIQLIGHFFKERNLSFTSVEQARVAVRRYLRVSLDITKFPKDKVFKAFDRVKSQHKDIDWSLETVLKKLTN